MRNPKRVGSNDGISTKGVLYTLLFVAVIALGAYGFYTHQQNKIKDLSKKEATAATQLATQQKKYSQLNATYAYTSKKGLDVKVYHPLSNANVSTPIVVIGEVPGSWSTDGSFPVQFVDKKGTIIAQTTAQLLSDWQTDQLVPFSAKLEYNLTSHGNGTIILKRDNPAGALISEDSVYVPISY